MNDSKLAEILYHACTYHKNFPGDPMHPWDELPPQIKAAWVSAATAVESHVNHVYSRDPLPRRSEQSQTDREHYAIVALIEAHRNEFDTYLNDLTNTASLNDKQTQNRNRQNKANQ